MQSTHRTAPRISQAAAGRLIVAGFIFTLLALVTGATMASATPQKLCYGPLCNVGTSNGGNPYGPINPNGGVIDPGPVTTAPPTTTPPTTTPPTTTPPTTTTGNGTGNGTGGNATGGSTGTVGTTGNTGNATGGSATTGGNPVGTSGGAQALPVNGQKITDQVGHQIDQARSDAKKTTDRSLLILVLVAVASFLVLALVIVAVRPRRA